MINVIGSVPNKIAIAVSGGPDSMAALNFLHNGGKRDVMALHFNHGSEHADEAQGAVEAYCERLNVPLVVGSISREKEAGESQEEYWRNQRYNFFSSYNDSAHKRAGASSDVLNRFFYAGTQIVTAHVLDDVVESYLFTALNGMARLIPYRRDNFLRPFLTTKKSEMLSWCDRKMVPYVVDPSNSDEKYMRNYIRHTLLPVCKRVNPGIDKVVKKMVEESFKNSVDFF